MKRIISAAMAVMLLICAAACSAEAPAEEIPKETAAPAEEAQTEETLTETAEKAEEKTRLTVGIDEKTDVLALLADSLGYFDEEEIEVELTGVNAEEAVEALKSGEIALCSVNAAAAASLDSENITLSVCNCLNGGLCVALNKDCKGYVTGEAACLSGKKIACVKNDIGAEVMRSAAESGGITDAEFIEYESTDDVITAVLRREADCGIVNGMSELYVRERGAGVAFAVEDFAREYPAAFIAVNGEKLIAESAFTAYYRALLRAWMTMLTDDGAAVSALAECLGKDEEYIYNYVYDGTTLFTFAACSEKLEMTGGITGEAPLAAVNDAAFLKALDECAEAYPEFEGFKELKEEIRG